MNFQRGWILYSLIYAVFACLSFGCASDGALDARKAQAARSRVLKTREAETYPFSLKPTGDASLDAIVGVMIQVANEKVESMEKVVAAGSNNMFEVVNTRMEEEFAKRELGDPTTEQRAQVRAEVSKNLTPEERGALTSACSVYEKAAGSYRKDEKKNQQVMAKAAADLAAKIATIQQGGGEGALAVGLSMFGGDDNSPIGKASKQADYSTDVIDDCDYVIEANESRATDALAIMNLGGKK